MRPSLAALRARIQALEHPSPRAEATLAFGVPALDEHLPQHGLSRGALHECAGGAHAAAAALFAAGILARLSGPVLWCASTPDIFAPGLAAAGLHPDRVLHGFLPDDATVLLAMEEALRHAALAAVLGEVARLGMTASRRLVLAAEKSGVMAIVLHRPRGPATAGHTAAATRWCITPVPSEPLPAPGLGRARWRVELQRCRGGRPGTWIMEACDAQGRLALPAPLPGRAFGAASRRAA